MVSDKYKFLLETPWQEAEVIKLPARMLAYLGDSIFEVGMRIRNMGPTSETAKMQHLTVSQMVCGSSQADFFSKLIEKVSPYEVGLLKSWRNAKLPNRPHAGFSRVEYARSTAFEAWVGYLFLTGRHERLAELFKWCMEENNERTLSRQESSTPEGASE
ncbi:MAG: hypothetical protein HQM08_12060 [Candidatus Riflebacteria bacterium]|nr:hypothetical protein [Candidatus Riflebacteria bacterium]